MSASPPLPEEITESIAIGNVKSVAEQSSMLSNLAFSNLIQNVNLSQQNAVANQQAVNQLGVTVLGKTVNLIANLSSGRAALTWLRATSPGCKGLACCTECGFLG